MRFRLPVVLQLLLLAHSSFGFRVHNSNAHGFSNIAPVIQSGKSQQQQQQQQHQQQQHQQCRHAHRRVSARMPRLVLLNHNHNHNNDPSPLSSEWDEEWSEIEEMGGDTSFLLPKKDEETWSSSLSSPSPSSSSSFAADNAKEEMVSEILEMGGDPFFLVEMGSPSIPPTKHTFNGEFLHASSRQRQTAATSEASGEIPSFVGSNSIRDDALLLVDDNHHNNNDHDLLEPPFVDSRVSPNSKSSDFYEEEDFDSDDFLVTAEELEAMGGDPCFLAPERETIQDLEDEIAELGGDPFFLSLQSTPSSPSPQQQQQQQQQQLQQKQQGPYYTAMEGEMFDSVLEELESLGGDAFFLDDPEIATATSSTSSWDGEEDIDDSIDAKTSSVDNNPMLDPSFLLHYVQQQQQSSSSRDEPNNNDSFINLAKDHRFSTSSSSASRQVKGETKVSSAQEEELLELGGDPSFLPSVDQEHESNAYQLELERAELEDLGGDPFFL